MFVEKVRAAFKDTLIKTASISASRSCVKDIIIASLKLAETLQIRGIADVKRPSGGCEKHAGCVIPHCVGPTTLLRHSLPAHLSQPLNFANLIRVSLNAAGSVSKEISERARVSGVSECPSDVRLCIRDTLYHVERYIEIGRIALGKSGPDMARCAKSSWCALGRRRRALLCVQPSCGAGGTGVVRG